MIIPLKSQGSLTTIEVQVGNGGDHGKEFPLIGVKCTSKARIH